MAVGPAVDLLTPWRAVGPEEGGSQRLGDAPATVGRGVGGADEADDGAGLAAAVERVELGALADGGLADGRGGEDFGDEASEGSSAARRPRGGRALTGAEKQKRKRANLRLRQQEGAALGGGDA